MAHSFIFYLAEGTTVFTFSSVCIIAFGSFPGLPTFYIKKLDFSVSEKLYYVLLQSLESILAAAIVPAVLALTHCPRTDSPQELMPICING